jgi:S-(hydroxymethyl)glutathione dehydrogenase/alcohol dehydrogenase
MADAAVSVEGAVFTGPGRPLRLEDLRLDPPGPGEVAVRMVASGICRSDLHVVDGDWERPAPLVGGHEGAAVVEALGAGVADGFPGLTAGALAILAWTAPCGACVACRRGEPWLCATPAGDGHRMRVGDVRLRRTDGTAVGVYSGIGTFGTRQVIAAEAAIPVDPATPPEVAALIGCAVATGVGAVTRTAGVSAGESVAIIGLGGVGLAAVMGAVLAGADPIVVLDTQPAKLDLARSLGATAAVRVDPADLARAEAAAARALAPADGFDHALECIGLAATCELAVNLVRRGGTATLVGMTAQGVRAELDVYRFVDDGKRILGSNYGSSLPAEAFPRLAALHLAGRLPVERLVSETIKLAGVNEALDAMRRGEGSRRVIRY